MTIFGLKIMTVKKYDEDILRAFDEGVKNGWDIAIIQEVVNDNTYKRAD